MRDTQGRNAGVAREQREIAASERVDLASSGVDVVVVEPGPFETALFPSSPRPKDVEGRVDSYPAVADQALENLGNAFEGMFNDPGTPTDPAMVVDQIIALADMEPGTRPFRSVVGVDVGVRERNAAVEPFDAAVLEAFGMTESATLAKTDPAERSDTHRKGKNASLS